MNKMKKKWKFLQLTTNGGGGMQSMDLTTSVQDLLATMQFTLTLFKIKT